MAEYLGSGLPKSSVLRRADSVLRSHRVRWWLHLLLFLLTFLTTTAFGSGLTQSFQTGVPLGLDRILDGYVRLGHMDGRFWNGMYFSVPLLLILLAHEFGHYLACLYWDVDASLPYFLPSPTLLGTLGAFIRIRSPILTRATLFDIGIAGPLAGFAVLLPFLTLGVILSQTTMVRNEDPLILGLPLLMKSMEQLRFSNIHTGIVVLHPFAVAGWAGLLATAVNLMPMGQLDGGHITYAALGPRWHRRVSTSFIALLVVLGFLYWAWWGWAVVMFFVGRRHPLVYDQSPLSGRRVLLSIVALILLIVSLAIVPVSAQ